MADRLRVPLTTPWRADAARVEGVSDLVKGRSARALYVTNDRKYVGCMTIRKRLDRRGGGFTVAQMVELVRAGLATATENAWSRARARSKSLR